MDSWNWEEHITLIAGASSTVIVLMRLLAVAYFDPETAFAIMQSAGTTTVIIGTLLASIWVVVAFIGMVTMRYFMLHGLNTQRRTMFDCAVFGGSIVILLTAPTATVLLIIIMVAMWMYIRRSYMGIGRGESHPNRIVGEFALGTGIALIILLGAYPWIPLERINVSNETQPHVGYVLRADSDAIVLLDDKRRRIDYLDRKDRTITRRLCNRHGMLEAALIDQPVLSLVFTSSPQYERC